MSIADPETRWSEYGVPDNTFRLPISNDVSLDRLILLRYEVVGLYVIRPPPGGGECARVTINKCRPNRGPVRLNEEGEP